MGDTRRFNPVGPGVPLVSTLGPITLSAGTGRLRQKRPGKLRWFSDRVASHRCFPPVFGGSARDFLQEAVLLSKKFNGSTGPNCTL